MPFKVKATVVGFAGDNDRYPCHFLYEIGDELVWDGERVHGRVCPYAMLSLMQTANNFWRAGKEPLGVKPIYSYCGLSKRDPNMKKYDGLGFAPIKETGFGLRWVDGVPQPIERPEKSLLICPDIKTGVTFRFEILGLSEKGCDAPYYNREMSIFEKIKAKPGIEINKILDEFTKWERKNIYPPLTFATVRLMLNELVQVDYIEIREEKAYPIKK